MIIDYSRCIYCKKEFKEGEDILEKWESIVGLIVARHEGNICISCFDEYESDLEDEEDLEYWEKED